MHDLLSIITMQKEYYGAPLSTDQVVYNKGQDLAYLSKQNSTKSPYERYLALSNPYSLLSKISSTTYADITNFSLSSLMKKVASVFNPTKIISGVFSLFGNRSYAAATAATDKSDYGIVQFGFTQQEDSLMDATTGDPSYQPLENAKILNESSINGGTVDAYMQATYGACFTDSMGTLLTSGPGGSGLGSGSNYIVRDKDGNVINTPTNGVKPGLCSEYYLGPSSHDPNAMDTTTKPGGGSYGNDLVFRWRLNQSYLKSLNVLTGAQNAGS